MSRIIDADALFAVVKGHHDLYRDATNPADKARRDECLQVMCDINDAPTIAAIPVEWLKKYTAVGVAPTGDRLTEGEERLAIHRILNEWQKEQEAR